MAGRNGISEPEIIKILAEVAAVAEANNQPQSKIDSILEKTRIFLESAG